MLAFVTSIRARALAKDWDSIVWLLERSVASMLAQTSEEFRIYVVCHDLPEISQAGAPQLRFIQMDIPLPVRTFEDMLIDKVLKITRGAETAVKDGCNLLMYADADDLVSRRLCAFVHKENAGPDGWYFQQGYAYRYGTHWLRRQDNHHMLCGTCNIVRAEALTFEHQAYYRGERVEVLAAAGHNQFIKNLRAQGRVARPLPFPGSVYIQHGDSTLTVQRENDLKDARPLWRRLAGRCKRAMQEARHITPLTPALRSEFTMLPPSQIPPRYRA